MGLPAIGGYELPNEENLPATKIQWKADRKRAALLIHDMQNYFLNAFPPDTSPLAPAVANIDRLRKHCVELGLPVLYTAQPGRQDPADRGLQRFFWGPGMDSGPEHQQIASALAPGEGDLVLVKWRYSAFQRTNLEHLLRARKRDQLIVTGVFAHIGCLLTAADAFMRDIEPFFVADAMADFSRADHDQAVSYVAGCVAAPITTNRLLNELR
jgi:bifunctional isochorismate lyase / aryl carrier protein